MKLNKTIAISSFVLPLLAVAEETAVTHTGNSAFGLGYLAAGFGIGIAAAGVGYAQSKAASAALDGIARNPAATQPLFQPLLLSLAFMEALVLFAFIITILLATKA